jgi:hypothetical protein
MGGRGRGGVAVRGFGRAAVAARIVGTASFALSCGVRWAREPPSAMLGNFAHCRGDQVLYRVGSIENLKFLPETVSGPLGTPPEPLHGSVRWDWSRGLSRSAEPGCGFGSPWVRMLHPCLWVWSRSAERACGFGFDLASVGGVLLVGLSRSGKRASGIGAASALEVVAQRWGVAT